MQTASGEECAAIERKGDLQARSTAYLAKMYEASRFFLMFHLSDRMRHLTPARPAQVKRVLELARY